MRLDAREPKRDLGNFDRAESLMRESMALARQAGDAGRGDEEEAAFLWGAAERGEERAGFRMLASKRVRYSSRLDSLGGSPAWESGRELGLDAAAEHALRAIDSNA